jgi:hypothetical protein
MQHEAFKLDGAAISDPVDPDQRILVFNFNVPIERAQEAASFERIRQQVEDDFPIESRESVVVPLYYQISAVYVLVHSDTGEERVWQGSYNPRARDLSTVTLFRPYDPATFVQHATTSCSQQNILNRLDNRATWDETVWRLSRILSVIVSVQATARIRHPVFINHPSLLGHGNRQQQQQQQQQHAQQPQQGANGRGRGGGARRQRRSAPTRFGVFRLLLD